MKNIFKRIFRKKQKMTLIDELKMHGATIGLNVDIINSSVDFIGLPLLSIGDNVTLTGCRLLLHDASTKKYLGYTKVGKVVIGNNCFIGAGSIILPNTIIGDNVIVGSGTVVAKSVPSNVVIVGNPYRILCTTEEYLNKMKDMMEKYPVYDCFFNELSKEQIDAIKKVGNCFIK